MKNFKTLVAVLIIVVFATTLSCKKENTIGAVSFDPNDTLPIFPDPETPFAHFYFQGQIDGRLVTINARDTVRDTLLYVNFADSMDHGTCSMGDSAYYFEQSSSFINPLDPNNRIIIRMFDCLSDTDTVAYKDSMIYAVSAYPFVNETSYSRGVKITWVDKDGQRWSTLPTSGTPEGAAFQLTFLDTNLWDTQSVRIAEGNLKAKLYPEAGGNDFIFINDAHFRCRLVRFKIGP